MSVSASAVFPLSSCIMSLVVGSSYVKAPNWMAAHVRFQRTNLKVFFDSANKAIQQKKGSEELQPNLDKLKQSITEEINLENKEEDVIKQSTTTDEIKFANEEKDAMFEDNLKVRVEELGARLMDFMNIFLQLQTFVNRNDDMLKTHCKEQ